MKNEIETPKFMPNLQPRFMSQFKLGVHVFAVDSTGISEIQIESQIDWVKDNNNLSDCFAINWE